MLELQAWLLLPFYLLEILAKRIVNLLRSSQPEKRSNPSSIMRWWDNDWLRLRFRGGSIERFDQN